MGIIIYPELAVNKLNEMGNHLNCLNETILEIETLLSDFIENDSLSGESWEVTENIANEYIIPLLCTVRLWIEYQSIGCETYKAALMELPYVNCLDEGALYEERDHWISLLNTYQSLIWGLGGGLYLTAVGTCNYYIGLINDKLESIEVFKNTTYNCFDMPLGMQDDFMAIGSFLQSVETNQNSIDDEWVMRIHAYYNYRLKLDNVNRIIDSLLLNIEYRDEEGNIDISVLMNSLQACPETLAVWTDLYERIHFEDLDRFDLSEEEIIALSMIADRFDNGPIIVYGLLQYAGGIAEGLSPQSTEFVRAILSCAIDAFYDTSSVLSINDDITRLFGFEYAGNDDDYYYTQRGSIQNHFGFMDYYDEIGNLLGMNLNDEVIVFNYGDREYRIELWRGTYGYGGAFGGEFGIYYRDASDAIANPYPEDYHTGTRPQNRFSLYQCLDEEHQFRVVQRVFLRDNDLPIVENDTQDYSIGTNGRHFWNLAIRTQSNVDVSQIYSAYNLYIYDDEMRMSVLNAMRDYSNTHGNIAVSEEYTDEDGFYIQIIWS